MDALTIEKGSKAASAKSSRGGLLARFDGGMICFASRVADRGRKWCYLHSAPTLDTRREQLLTKRPES
jgi:hypothetical protein